MALGALLFVRQPGGPPHLAPPPTTEAAAVEKVQVGVGGRVFGRSGAQLGSWVDVRMFAVGWSCAGTS